MKFGLRGQSSFEPMHWHDSDGFSGYLGNDAPDLLRAACELPLYYKAHTIAQFAHTLVVNTPCRRRP